MDSGIPSSLNLHEGYTTEINLQANAWVKSLYDFLDDGVVFLIDYGMTESEYFHPQRSQGTLKCFSNHKSNDDPFINIGKQDITASINFSHVAQSAEDCGFEVSGYTTQSMFLISLGIEKYLKNEENEEKRVKIAQEIKQLVLPGTMGEVFKVMALSKKQSVKLDGFKELDLTNRL
jgi:SAM-dependent MidA family methyltransferase